MSFKFRSQDQPSRDGGVDDPSDAQLQGATADGAPADPPEPGGASAVDAALASESASELAAERDRNLRLRAEIENVRSRTARELATERRYAALPVVRDLLPVLDNVDRAIAAAEKSGDAGVLVDGFRMVRQQLITILEQHHVVAIHPEGELFDPQQHEAILQQPSDKIPADHVLAVTQTGYQMHDRVVRPAQVIVSSGPA